MALTDCGVLVANCLQGSCGISPFIEIRCHTAWPINLLFPLACPIGIGKHPYPNWPIVYTIVRMAVGHDGHEVSRYLVATTPTPIAKIQSGYLPNTIFSNPVSIHVVYQT